MTDKLITTEDQLQAEFWKKIWNYYPQIRGCMWAVPNSAIGQIMSLKDQLQANKLKATGTLEGVWDIHLFYKNQFYIIETKLPGNYLTVDRIDKKSKKHRGQKEWGELMASHGAIRYIYHSVEEGIAFIENIVNATNES